MMGNNRKPSSGAKKNTTAKAQVKKTAPKIDVDNEPQDEHEDEPQTVSNGPNRARATQVRPAVRAADLRERAKIELTLDDAEEGTGQLYVPPEMIPDGFAIEWKRISTYGKPEEPTYLLKLAQNGWEPASVEDFRGLMPADYEGDTVIREGMILMIRPKEYSDKVKKFNLKKARGQLSDKLDQINHSGKDEVKREVTAFSRTHAPAEID